MEVLVSTKAARKGTMYEVYFQARMSQRHQHVWLYKSSVISRNAGGPLTRDRLRTQLHEYTQFRQKCYISTLLARQWLLSCLNTMAREGLWQALLAFGVSKSRPSPSTAIVAGQIQCQLDRNKHDAFSAFLRRSNRQLPLFHNRDDWISIIRHDVASSWSRSRKGQLSPQPNHSSATIALNMLVKGIIKGQNDGRYPILDLGLLSQLDGITCSPFAVVSNGDEDLSVDAKIIRGLSYTRHIPSINDHSIEFPMSWSRTMGQGH
ncbi:hypothetical protein GN958_ATG01721 [Phytophthora infestans]|uniref:Uncharacterized protein n=1 Tax=Phytophthora infestans TaxID=4787 RepID=A0A8S9V930_PHYIN|nr:hypothetical protein GN958_ATG01721 [Phytophthora infestans]